MGFAGEFFFVALGLQYTNASHISVLLYTAGTGYMGAVGLRTGLIKVSLVQADKNRLRDE